MQKRTISILGYDIYHALYSHLRRFRFLSDLYGHIYIPTHPILSVALPSIVVYLLTAPIIYNRYLYSCALSLENVLAVCQEPVYSVKDKQMNPEATRKLFGTEDAELVGLVHVVLCIVLWGDSLNLRVLAV